MPVTRASRRQHRSEDDDILDVASLRMSPPKRNKRNKRTKDVVRDVIQESEDENVDSKKMKDENEKPSRRSKNGRKGSKDEETEKREHDDEKESKNEETEEENEKPSRRRKNNKKESKGEENVEEKVSSAIKRESTYIIDTKSAGDVPAKGEEVVLNVTHEKPKNIFSAASPCRLFKPDKKIATEQRTPLKTICRSISVGSAGKTPMPPPKKDELNVTHSIETAKSEVDALPTVGAVQRQLTFTKTTLPKRNENKGFKPLIKNRTAIQKNDKKITRGISKLPKKTTLAYSHAKTEQILKVLQHNNVQSTPNKIIKTAGPPLSKSKMPNFASLHKKQFDKMESLVQNKIRKGERAKQLFNVSGSVKPKAELERIEPATGKLPDSHTPKCFTRFGFKLLESSEAGGGGGFKMLPSVSYANSPISNTTLASMTRERTKSGTDGGGKPKKLTKRTTTRSENQCYIVGVKTNRQFDLRMKARNM